MVKSCGIIHIGPETGWRWWDGKHLYMDDDACMGIYRDDCPSDRENTCGFVFEEWILLCERCLRVNGIKW